MTDPQTLEFLGTGWSFPPEFGPNGSDVVMVSGLEDIRQSLDIILATGLRERLWHDDFGADLNAFLFEEIDQHLISQIKRRLGDALLYHEPRIAVQQIDITQSADEIGLLLINVIFSIPNTNSRYNMVYPFYINEGVR